MRGVGLLINGGGGESSVNYDYIYGYIKVWVSCKMQSIFQQKRV